MIRVTTNEDDRARPIIIIDGELSGESVAVVEACFKEPASGCRPGTLYLREVATVDHAGKALLLRLSREGITLRASGLYTSYLVESLDGDPDNPGRTRDAKRKPR